MTGEQPSARGVSPASALAQRIAWFIARCELRVRDPAEREHPEETKDFLQEARAIAREVVLIGLGKHVATVNAIEHEFSRTGRGAAGLAKSWKETHVALLGLRDLVAAAVVAPAAPRGTKLPFGAYKGVPFGVLGDATINELSTEEGLAAYQERKRAQGARLNEQAAAAAGVLDRRRRRGLVTDAGATQAPVGAGSASTRRRGDPRAASSTSASTADVDRGRATGGQRWTIEKRRRLTEMYARGDSIEGIAREFDRAPATIQRRLDPIVAGPQGPALERVRAAAIAERRKARTEPLGERERDVDSSGSIASARTANSDD